MTSKGYQERKEKLHNRKWTVPKISNHFHENHNSWHFSKTRKKFYIVTEQNGMLVIVPINSAFCFNSIKEGYWLRCHQKRQYKLRIAYHILGQFMIYRSQDGHIKFCHYVWEYGNGLMILISYESWKSEIKSVLRGWNHLEFR